MPNQLHDDVLNFLETYRTKHPDFVYWLRQRNTNNRLNDGYWFQGIPFENKISIAVSRYTKKN